MQIKPNNYRNNPSVLLIRHSHFLFQIVLFFFSWLVFRYDFVNLNIWDTGYRYNFFVTVLYAVLVMFFNNTYNSYLFGFTRLRGLVFSQFISQLFSSSIIYVGVSIAWKHFDNPIALFVMLVVDFVLDVLFSILGNTKFYKVNPPKEAIILYEDNVDLKRITELSGKPIDRLFIFKESICCIGKSFKDIEEKLEQYDVIFVSGIESRIRNGVLKHCAESNKQGFFLPHVGDVILKGSTHIQSFSAPIHAVSRQKPNFWYLFIKRLFDIVVSFIGIIVLSPFMLFTAILIKTYDHGPILYKQTRLTRDEKLFKILKFRSMRVDAEKDGKARLSTGDKDDRITPVGRFIRKCRFDELPQLFNILKGDMTIVGPRPERPEIAEEYYKTIPSFKLRLQVKAGLTGYAQVYGKYNTEPYEKLEFDLLYINNMNILTDLRLMFATFSILFQKESTDGIEVGQTNAMVYENSADSTDNKEKMTAK